MSRSKPKNYPYHTILLFLKAIFEGRSSGGNIQYIRVSFRHKYYTYYIYTLLAKQANHHFFRFSIGVHSIYFLIHIMQELTLTGGTLLPNYNQSSSSDPQQAPPNSNNAASLLSFESSPFTIAHEHSTMTNPTAGSSNTVAVAHHHKSHNHSHHHHQHQHSKACCSAHVSTVKPVLTLKKPAMELAAEYDDRQMYQTVQQCVRMGSYELVEELVQAWKEVRGPNNAAVVDQVLHEYDAAGHTLTHWSAKRVDDVRFVHFFLKIPYRPDTTEDDHDSNKRRTIYPTVAHRPTRDETAMTPLHWVATQPHAIPVLQALLDATSTRSSVDATKSNVPSGLELRDATGCTPLLIAAQHGHVETVAYLIQKGADIHKTDSSNDSATHWAAYKGSEQVLGLLSFYDTRQLLTPDAYGQTPYVFLLMKNVLGCVY
jgi:ankyrin repeat protein